MTELLTQDLSLAQVRSLIDSYAFDLGDHNTEELLKCWSEAYNASWIRLATIEALYLGRYKAISIEQILNVWLRLGIPSTHFTYEFERLICRKLPKHLNNFAGITADEDEAASISLESFDYHKSDRSCVKPIKSTKVPQPQIGKVSNDTLSSKSAFQKPDQAIAKDREQLTEKPMPFISALGLTYKADWSEFALGTKMIHQFIPLPDVSSFFNKLKTFGEERLEGQ